jgi:hypothetical protein
MAAKKASEFGERFRNVTLRERRASSGRPPDAEGAEPRPADPRSISSGGVGDSEARPAAGARGPQAPPPVRGRSYVVGSPKTVGRKARVALRAGTGRHRFTLDLDGIQHRYLKQLALDAGTDMASVMRVLISSLEEDPVLRNEVAMRARGDEGTSVVR